MRRVRGYEMCFVGLVVIVGSYTRRQPETAYFNHLRSTAASRPLVLPKPPFRLFTVTTEPDWHGQTHTPKV